MSNARAGWERLKPRLPIILAVGGTAVVMAIITAISYEHEYLLAWHNQQPRWVATLIPFSVDGILVVASIALYWAHAHNIRRPWQPWAVAAVGMVATIGANFTSDLQGKWIGPAVAGSAGVAAVLVGLVAAWMIEMNRRLASGESLQPARDCDCPRPPVNLAEALPLARAERRYRGLPAGEQALADGFETTRHRVKQSFAEPVVMSVNGSGPHE